MRGQTVTKARWPGRVRQIGAVVAPVALLALMAWLLWPDGDLPQSRERVVTTINMVQPPPPPPEPEDQIMEEEEIVEPEEAPPSETPNEQPSETPQDSPAEPTSSQLAGLDRPADAGSDNFRLAAGGGGGLFGRGAGGGGGGGEWGAYVEGHIRRALMRDSRTRAARGSVDVTVVISEAGRFTQAVLRGTTDDPDLDAAIRQVLRGLPPLSVPRPADRAATTYATIDMRRS